jgi:hypothetical protein
MIKTVSIDSLTDEEIESLSMRRIKAAIGNNVDLIGSTEPGHVETKPTCECTLCRNGQRLDKAGKTVCLRCNRASKRIDKVIASVKAEERILRAIAARKQVDMIKARAAAQRLGRRGAKLNPVKKKIVMQSILDRLCGNDE